MTRSQREHGRRQPRLRRWVAAGVLLGGTLWLLAQWPVTTRFGVNYVWSAKRIPLYAKAVNFLSRDIQTRQIVREIVAGVVSEEEKLLRIFSWVTEHIRDVPEGFPLVDDHAFHVIIRGYGGEDQRTETFVLLAGYAGYDAAVANTMLPESRNALMLALVHLGHRTVLFDVVNQVVFRNETGELADLSELLDRPQLITAAVPERKIGGLPYVQYVLKLREERRLFSRTQAQQVWPRLKQEIRRLVGKTAAHRTALEIH